MEITLVFSPDVPQGARKTLGWLIPRSIESGLGRMKALRTSLPDATHQRVMDGFDRIAYLFNYEDRDDDIIVTVTVEPPADS